MADSAWNITKGDTSVKIAIMDTWFDINHPDLANQLVCTYDPYDLQPFYTDGTKSGHGTAVASFAAAETDGGGQLASVGFRCRIIPYKAWSGHYLERAHHASLAMHADILTSSAGGWNCDRNFNMKCRMQFLFHMSIYGTLFWIILRCIVVNLFLWE